MRIRQRAYFAVKSDRLSAAEITARLGLGPDESTVRGSRVADPPRPALHAWTIRCDRAVRVDEQLGELMARLAPVRAALTTLLAEGHYGVLQVVRHLADPEGDLERHPQRDDDLEVLEGQHQLLGWHLDRAMIEFLVETGVELDVDEYG
ncbi:MAG: DUF4279 domain-containing protein [Deltaproteobacteria bacterium]|nr:DUF4279 domain-containing protein [Deltaproteobacteria bacterium]